MRNPVLPSLSEDGWVDNSAKIADYMLSHFFVADYSQSYIYHTYVSSLPWILTQNQGNMGKTCSEVQNVLSAYFMRYFNNVVVEVTEVPNTENPSYGQISIYVRFTDVAGNEIVLGKVVQTSGNVIQKIINISNG